MIQSTSRPRRKDFVSLQDKTLHNVLLQLFASEFGFADKMLFARAMVERILEAIERFVQPSTYVKPGQMLWMAVAHDGRKHARQRMREIPQVPVLLDLVTDDDLQALTDGEPFRRIRRRRLARLFDQAFAQGGVLAQADVSAMLLGSSGQVRRDIRAVRQTTKRLLPYRGSVQDLGPTLTHKLEAVRLYEQGHLEPEICRLLSPEHSLQSVERYIQTYKNVLKLLDRCFTIPEISGILSISERLVRAYVEIVYEHHPDILARRPESEL